MPDGSRLQLEWRTQDSDAGLNYQSKITSEDAGFERVELVLNIAPEVFASGRLRVDGGTPIMLPHAGPEGPQGHAGSFSRLQLENASGTVRIAIDFGTPREAALLDRWEVQGDVIRTRMPLDEGGQTGTMYLARTQRSYQLIMPVLRSGERQGEFSARMAHESVNAAPEARLSVDPGRTRYTFDGFGGNFCWDNGKGNSAIQAYILENLKLAWARTEMKLVSWDALGRRPGADVRMDLENMRRFQKMGVPYVISIWRLPERFYADAYEKLRGERFRVIDPGRWAELNDLVGSYLLHAK